MPAHDLVYELCRKAATSGKPLPSLLVAEPEIIRYLEKGPVAGLTDPENYLDLAGEMVDRVLCVTASIPH